MKKRLFALVLAVISVSELSACGGTIVYDRELGSGYYTAGIDFPAGTYDIEVISGNGVVYTLSPDYDELPDSFSEMMGVKEDGMYEYQKSHSNLSLPKDTVLSVSGGVTIKIHSDSASGEALARREQSITENVWLENGSFVAGTDFPAGVYDIVAVSGSGNVSSDNMAEGGICDVMGTKDVSGLYQNEYRNIYLPEGITLKVGGDVEIVLTPSI